MPPVKPKQKPKPKPKKRKPAKKIKTVQIVQTFEESFVTVKAEPAEAFNLVVETSHCRCCFKLMNNQEVQFVANEDILRTFQEVIQISLANSAIATNFCEKCFNDINNYSQFKNLSIAKQQKFLEISTNGGDINMIYEMKVSHRDPLFKDEDTEQKSVVKEETFNWNQDFEVAAESFEDSPEEQIDSFSHSENEISCSENLPEPNSPAEKQIKIPFSTRAKCQQCGMKPRDMRKHLVDYHPIKCYKCRFKAADTEEMMEHIEKRHDAEEQLEPQACQICGKMIRQNMKQHIEAVHENIKKYFCDICGFAGYHRQQMNNHMHKTHLKTVIKCKECDFIAVTNWRLKLHVRNKHMARDPRIKCDHCSRVFCSKAYLQIHIARKHQNKKEAFCSICKREFFSKNDLE